MELKSIIDQTEVITSWAHNLPQPSLSNKQSNTTLQQSITTQLINTTQQEATAPKASRGPDRNRQHRRQTSPQYSRQDKQQQQANKTRRAGHNDKPSPSFRDAQIAPSALVAQKDSKTIFVGNCLF